MPFAGECPENTIREPPGHGFDRQGPQCHLPAAPEPQPAPAAAPAPISAVRDSDPDAGEAGWHIQIGAVPTMEGAHALLESAQASMGPVLASLHPLTQPVERNGTTLYRARFAGFPDKEQARAACAKLQMKSIDCLAVPN